MSLAPPAGNRAHAKNEIIQGLRLLRRRRNYSAHLFAQQRMRRTSQLVGLDFSTGRSISLLPVMASVAKARLIFITFRELRLTRRLNWRNAFHTCVFAKLFLPAWENGRRLNLKNNGVYGTRFWLKKSLQFSIFRIEWLLMGYKRDTQGDFRKSPNLVRILY